MIKKYLKAEYPKVSKSDSHVSIQKYPKNKYPKRKETGQLNSLTIKAAKLAHNIQHIAARHKQLKGISSKLPHNRPPFPMGLQSFPCGFTSFSLWICKPFPMDLQAFPYGLTSLSLWISKSFLMVYIYLLISLCLANVDPAVRHLVIFMTSLTKSPQSKRLSAKTHSNRKRICWMTLCPLEQRLNIRFASVFLDSSLYTQNDLGSPPRVTCSGMCMK